MYAQQNQDRARRVIVSRLKATWLTATVLKDFLDILKDYGLYDKKNYNKSVGAVAVDNKSLLIAAL